MSIFEDNNKLIENTRESARALGFNVPNMVKKKVHIAKKKCKTCLGRGILITSFPGNFGFQEKNKSLCGCVVEKEIEVPEVRESI
jgi:hypothetical protein